MAKALLICRRHGFSPESDEDLTRLMASLIPSHIEPRAPSIARAGAIVSVVANAGPSVRRDGVSIALGVLESDGHWSVPRAPVPDGSFALFRADGDHVELVADTAASRTIWYAMTNEVFVASTSQRAVVSVLGDFRPNLEAAAWLLSSGALGPGRGWDARVERVPPGGRVLLRRASWRLETREMPISLEPPAGAPPDPDELGRGLEAIVDDVAARLDLDFSRWVVPLSGGVDSRGLLLALGRARRGYGDLKCITWGRRAALDERGNDARIARELAERLGVEHDYFVVEATTEPRERFLERFLVAGEGRVDAMGGYMDGFAVWRQLYAAGVEGVIRGDEAFGWKTVQSDAGVRESVHLTTLDDVCGERAARELGLPAQRIPDALQRRSDESLAAWRDRLYQQYRLPVILAALTDLKTSYVEVVNPFLYARVLAYARTLPDELRTNKRLWRGMVDAWSPRLSYATRTAVPPPRTLTADAEMLALMLDELGSARTAALFGAAARTVRGALEASMRRSALSGLVSNRSRFGRVLRTAKKHFLGRLHVDSYALAFRMLIAARMCALLGADASAGRRRYDVENLVGEMS
ncbi:MAG TPA: asparagine synthase-related protein [Gammaproteobacteria bacterium]